MDRTKNKKHVDAPGDTFIEKSVISAFITKKQALQRIHELSIDDFIDPMNKIIFGVVADLFDRGIQPDFPMVYQSVMETGSDIKADAVLDFANFYSPISWSEHIDKIIDMSRRRRLMNVGEEMIAMSKSEIHSTGEIVEVLEMNASAITQERAVRYCTLETITRHEEKIFEIARGLNTGIQEIDDILHGFHGGQLIIIGARPSVGKTALALQIAKHIAQDEPTIFFSLEMPKMQLVRRMLTAETGISANRIRTGKIDNVDKDDLRSKLKEIGQRYKHLTIVDNANRFNSITNIMRKYVDQHGLRAVFIDYLQLIKSESRVDRYLQIGEMTSTLKELSIKYNIPIVVLSQMSRSSSGREPELEDLRESGNIEQDADVVLFPHRKKNTDEDVKMIVAKNRDGEIGFKELKYDRSRVTYFSPQYFVQGNLY